MCGIFGAVNKQIDEGLARACTDRLVHRGPDSGKVWQEPGVTLGHRRLAIFDLSEKGIQPMPYAGGRYMIVYNGEVYNFPELRSELSGLGYEFTSDCDSEVIMAAYMEWGSACLDRLNGMWAFAIWDREEKKLFMSRDRFGVKPLYYTFLDKDKTSIAFASEMKALMPLMDEIRPNRDIVTDPNRIVYYESTDECVIENIYRFPAGCYATFDKKLEIKRFWNTLDNLMELPESYEEQVEICRDIFLDACKLRMRADVTIGTALSGGLDSSATICAMAHLARSKEDARMNRDWQHAYVASFPGTTVDETAYAKTVTDFLGIDSTFVTIDPLSAIDRLGDFVYLQEDVYLTSPIPMMLLYGALRADGTVVTIDGHGADELFGGYTFDFVKALADAKTPEERELVTTAYIESFPKDGSNMAMKYPTVWGIRMDEAKKKLADIKNAHRQPYKKVRAANDPHYKKMDRLGKILYASSHETILPTLLRNYDRYSMANSVEIRMPFMDHRMVTLGMSLPWKSRLHGGFSKSIIRDAMAPFMPKEIAYRRTKIGFNTPIVEWMQGPLRTYFLEMTESSSFIGCDLIDPGTVRAEISEVINNPKATFAMGEKAFMDLYPYLWEQHFLKRAQAAWK
ncbi:MAG: asparagine synthase (glutamine-hydrolyzing) [Lachnospiraceae bacterium]|nr:asparagine synthase (glutamine-hydrolyzing) [Lachnospiraceae bacterium]